MKTNNVKIKKVSAISVVVFALVTGFLVGCQERENNDIELLDESSLEIEEYIIAGLDYQQALNIFNSEIKNIDFSRIEKSIDVKGNIIVKIPTSVSIEEKARTFNEKKDGTTMTYIDDTFNSTTCTYPPLGKIGNNWYISYYSSPVSYVLHTHRYSSSPSTEDISTANQYPGLQQGIYTSGGNENCYY
ncbi:hypothetical protein FACS189430_09610 [Bacteroidia bacterium]|nr:hypothetical protein FACS189430_09610 [Bacteroidia bacterium]